MATTEILRGSKYQAYVKLGELPLRATSFSTSIADNILRANGAYSSLLEGNANSVPAPNRRKLTVSLSSEMTLPLLLYGLEQTIGWRSGVGNLEFITGHIYHSTGMHFVFTWGILEDFGITVSAGSLAQLNFNISTWIWNEGFSQAAQDDVSQAYDPFGDENYQVVPGHFVTCEIDSIPGVVSNFQFQFSNAITYRFLMENTLIPANPRIVVPGRLEGNLSITHYPFLTDQKPECLDAAVMTVDGITNGVNFPTVVLNCPSLYRTEWQVPGSADSSPITVSSSWELRNQVPTYT